MCPKEDATTNNKNNDDEAKKENYEEVYQLLALRTKKTKISHPPAAVADLTALTKLDLPGCNLSELPNSLPDALPNLSILFLSNNEFTELPAIIGNCPKLQMVAFKSNKLTKIHPDSLQAQMRWLILTDNQITEIPAEIGRCKKLQKFMLSGNLLTELPEEIVECSNLELIRLSSNKLQNPPMTLLSLPNLCWVALSGNPFINTQNNNTATTDNNLKLNIIDDIPEGEGEILGRGAGGITRKVLWKSCQNQPVAVKTFCGVMTSDGSPEEERKMSLTVSSKIKSDFLIELLGETRTGGSLVMEYLDNYSTLAGPPSLETCSRDCYPESRNNTYMTEDQALHLITGLLDVLDQLHQHGIIHGDFYAHNILISNDDKYKIKLSDFGAAFFYDTGAEYAPKLQRTELRAFSHLVNEVLERFVHHDDNNNTTATLFQNLIKNCREDSASFAKVNQAWKAAISK